MGVRYENAWEDRIRNYMIVANELGSDGSDVIEHFKSILGSDAVNTIAAYVTAELDNPFSFFDAIYCIGSAGGAAAAQFDQAGIGARIRWFEADRTVSNSHASSALAHRAIVEESAKQGLGNVLVFEDDVILTHDVLHYLQTAVRELNGHAWDLFYLGGCRWEHKFARVQGCTALEHAGPLTCLYAVAYNHTIYRRILDEVPRDAAAMEEWLLTWRGLDQYFAFSIDERKFVVAPVVATRAAIPELEDQEVATRIMSSLQQT
jgi:GR25 family glycosyltransferase involved in LPS biosynthesis